MFTQFLGSLVIRARVPCKRLDYKDPKDGNGGVCR